MDLSVVVPTLNGRERLGACLDALTERAPTAEVIVVNGPSADGTTGMVRARRDVDRLVEVSDRRATVARNAGVEAATGEIVAFVGDDHRVTDGWADAVRAAIDEGADAVTGPCRRTVRGGATSESAEQRRVGGREVTFFNADNAAFDAATLRRLDGFDESLRTGGARDAAHRLAGLEGTVRWRAEAATVREAPAADGGRDPAEWGWTYRALGYRLVKNYGPRPTVLARLVGRAVGDGVRAGIDVIRGNGQPSRWLGNGKNVAGGAVRGVRDGLRARTEDTSDSRNPHGLSDRSDRAVSVYEE
jgi:Glycosyltransferases involved in cell wall biogenesis